MGPNASHRGSDANSAASLGDFIDNENKANEFSAVSNASWLFSAGSLGATLYFYWDEEMNPIENPPVMVDYNDLLRKCRKNANDLSAAAQKLSADTARLQEELRLLSSGGETVQVSVKPDVGKPDVIRISVAKPSQTAVQQKENQLSLLIDKPLGYNVSGEKWEDESFHRNYAFSAIGTHTEDEFVELVRLPEYPLFFVDISEDPINANMLRDTLTSRFRAILRSDVRSCYLWMSPIGDGGEGFFGNLDSAKILLNKVYQGGGMPQSFYSDFNSMVKKFRAAKPYSQRLKFHIHGYLSKSTYKWIRRDESGLEKFLLDREIFPDMVTFYSDAPEAQQTPYLGGYKIVYWAH